MSNIHYISSELIDLPTIKLIIEERKTIELSEEAILNINKSKHYLDKKIENNPIPIYGINTGFGSLCNNIISSDNLSQLQYNLVVSHACGVGEEVPEDIVKIMIILKIQSLAYGNSGVQLKTINRLLELYNNNIFPVIYEQGSLGASGDLAPLAHLSLALLGLGQANFNNTKLDVKEIF